MNADKIELLACLKEANRHIEALAVARKDNDWDMISAIGARNRILEQLDAGKLKTEELKKK